MDETKYAEAKRNRELRDELEKRRQQAVDMSRWLFQKGRPLLLIEEGAELHYQVPISAHILSEALTLWKDRTKKRILELDTEFNQL
jgi:hypothetical protein